MLLMVLVTFSLAGRGAVHFLTIADIHYGAKNTPGDGHDTSPQLLTLAMKKYAQLSSQVDFIIVLGDMPTHLLGYAPIKAEYEKTVFHALYQADQSKKPLFYVPGNNDALRGNYQPFNAAGQTPLDWASDWDGACAFCEGLRLDDRAMVSDGYYSSYVIPGNQDIMLIVLNSTPFARIPFFVPSYPHQQEAADRELHWLKEQLSTHKARQLLIAMHIPPGNNAQGSPLWHKAYQDTFIHLLQEYRSRYGQISLLTSHTHMDEIRKITLPQATIYAYSTPSISRDHHNFPGMKRFSLNDQAAIVDFTTYYTRSSTHWDNDHYDALQGKDAIFPHCVSDSLAACLDSLSQDAVCKRLDVGHFYGVKHDAVPAQGCAVIYQVNA